MRIVILLILYSILLGLSFWFMTNNYMCDSHDCNIFQGCINKSDKEKAKHLLNNLGDDNLWIFGFITAAIIAGLFFIYYLLD